MSYLVLYIYIYINLYTRVLLVSKFRVSCIRVLTAIIVVYVFSCINKVLFFVYVFSCTNFYFYFFRVYIFVHQYIFLFFLVYFVYFSCINVNACFVYSHSNCNLNKKFENKVDNWFYGPTLTKTDVYNKT